MQWVCDICGYVHEEDEPPELCPVCGAPQSKFSEADQNWDEEVPKVADAVVDIDDDTDIDVDTVDEDGDDDEEETEEAGEYFDENDFSEYADEDEDR